MLLSCDFDPAILPEDATLTRRLLLALVALTLLPTAAVGGDVNFSRQEDVIYGRKFGLALTFDVLRPEQPNGAAVVWVISGGWFSAKEAIQPLFVTELLNRGYTVFAVVHGSQPRFTIPECIEDLDRAVRFIRLHAQEYGVDPQRFGITGASAGGHLSLMQGTAGDEGNASANDPVARTSSRVQAVACFFPPTDFLNYGKEGEIALGRGVLKDFAAPFDFQRYDQQKRAFVRITDEEEILKIGRQISPVNHVSADDPPTLIIHGDADVLVPIQQAQIMVEKLHRAGVTAELVIKKGAGHGWPDLLADMALIADWFDKHLAKKENEAVP
jgi:acetyl esterase/lipase